MKYLYCFSLITLLFSVFFSPIHAEEIRLGGLLLDNSISRQGHEFASRISQYWREVPDSSGKVIYDNRVVYQTYMGRRQVPLDEKVQQAIMLVLDAVANASIDSRSPDLAGDEW